MPEPATTAVTIGSILGIVAAGAASAWAWIERIRRSRAETGASVAVSESQATVFDMMKNRLQALEDEMKLLRQELHTERQHGRKMELHIFKLENLMRKAGLEPPVFEDA